MATFQYFLNDYNAILFGTYKNDSEQDIPMNYKLPQEVMDVISILATKFGYNNIIPSISIEQKTKKHRKYAKQYEESWINSCDFKPTIIIEKKEGNDKIMNEIRSALNKISNKNYEANRDMILKLMNDILLQEKSNEDIHKIANNIFDIASTNKFFSEIYANLYKEISQQFVEIFNEILTNFLEGFTSTMKTIKYVDQKENYDDFCKYNKENDKRKATSIFISNLVKKLVIHPEILKKIIRDIQIIINENMNQYNKTNEVEEVVENMFLLLINDTDFLKSCDNTDIIMFVKNISTMKPKDVPSISSRAIFKCLDIVEKIKK